MIEVIFGIVLALIVGFFACFLASSLRTGNFSHFSLDFCLLLSLIVGVVSFALFVVGCVVLCRSCILG